MIERRFCHRFSAKHTFALMSLSHPLLLAVVESDRRWRLSQEADQLPNGRDQSRGSGGR